MKTTDNLAFLPNFNKEKYLPNNRTQSIKVFFTAKTQSKIYLNTENPTIQIYLRKLISF